jgi:hypothetical protein
MFRAHTNSVGATTGSTTDGSGRLVVTLWTDEHAVAALERSETYLETVRAIEATGFLVGETSLEALLLDDVDLPLLCASPRRVCRGKHDKATRAPGRARGRVLARREPPSASPRQGA